MNVNLIAKVLIICLGLLEAVTSDPVTHTASDGRVYAIEMSHEYNWHDAWLECAKTGYQLASIDSASKNAALIELLTNIDGRSKDFWLGGNDEYSSSTDYNRPFFWFSSGSRLNFTFWSDDNPNNAFKNEHCVHIYSRSDSFKWNDIDCEYKFGYICEPQE